MAYPALQMAISRLAKLFDGGALLADTDPTGFIDHTREEITRLRAKVEDLRGLLMEHQYAREKFGPYMVRSTNVCVECEEPEGKPCDSTCRLAAALKREEEKS